MHVLLFLGGFVFVVTGFAALGFGVSEHRLAGSSALILPGVVAAVGGLLLLGLGSVVARLARITEILETQPLPRTIATAPEIVVGPAAPSVETDKAAAPEVQPPVRADEAPARDAPPVAVDPPAKEQGASAATPPPAATNGAAPAVAPPAAPPVAPPVAPSVAVPFVPEPPRVVPEPPKVAPAPAVPPVQQPAAATNGGGAARVLKSGVIEGMAYTLYSDGAVDAELPQHGTMRFASIAEWRAYIRGEQ